MMSEKIALARGGALGPEWTLIRWWCVHSRLKADSPHWGKWKADPDGERKLYFVAEDYAKAFNHKLRQRFQHRNSWVYPVVVLTYNGGKTGLVLPRNAEEPRKGMMLGAALVKMLENCEK
jgi:hypothetical protein